MKPSRPITAFLLLALCIACALACSAEAAVHTSGDYTYLLLPDGTAEITGYTGQENALQIPDQLDGHTVSAIGAEAFAGNTHLSAVYIPGCVGYIRENAFRECKALISVSIGEQIAFVDMEETYSETQFIQAAAVGMGAEDHGSGSVSLAESYGTPYQPILTVRAVMEEVYLGKTRHTFACRVDHFLALGFKAQTITTDVLDSILAWEEQTGVQLLYPLGKNDIDASIWYTVNRKNQPTDAYSEDMLMTSDIQVDENGEPIRWEITGTDPSTQVRVRVLNAAYYQYLYGHEAVYPTFNNPLFTPSSAAPAGDGLTICDNAFFRCDSLVAVSLPAETTSVSDSALQYVYTHPIRVMPYGSTAEGACLDAYFLTYTRYSGEKGLAPGDDPTTYTIGDFQYRVLADQSAEIIYCTASAAQTLVIPDELGGHPVTAINNQALRDCAKLTDIHIPASVAQLGGEHFTNVDTLRAIHVAEDHPTLVSIDGVLIDLVSRTLLYCPQGKVEEAYAVPKGIRAIGGGAFRFCSLLNIELPDSVTSIGPLAFFWSAGTAGITIPDSVTSIGKSAFNMCQNLTSIHIPSGMTIIEDHLLDMCTSLTSVALPNGITTIGYRAFAGCIALTEVNIPRSVTSIGSCAFANCRMNSIVIPDGIETIEPFTFQSCRNLTEITIPGSVRSIGAHAFQDCTSLESVTVKSSAPQGIFSFLNRSGEPTSIGENAFYGCYVLTSVTLPENVDFIADNAFINDSFSSKEAILTRMRLTVYAPAGSYAEEYCDRLDLEFEATK